MISLEYKDGLLFISLEIEFKGAGKIVDNMVIDTCAAETILSPDTVEDIGLFAESSDYVHSFYGVGGSLHNFFRKSVDSVVFGTAHLEAIKLDFGLIDPQGNINELIGLDILVKLKAIVLG